MPRPTAAQIYPERLQHNLQRVREAAPGSRVLCCVKSDGYGHGAAAVARALAPDCDGFAVATLEEALELRETGIPGRILLLEGVHEPGDWLRASLAGFSVCISGLHQIDWLEQQPPGGPVECWLKIDSGMHRLGVAPEDAAAALARLRANSLVRGPVVLATHFASADHTPPDEARGQLARFLDAAAPLDCPLSCANSAAILALPEAHLDWVRPGYMLYGGSPIGERSAADCGLLPAMRLLSEVIALRDVPVGETVGYSGRWRAERPSRIATVAVGYGDGYPRHAPDGTPVSVAGKRAPLAGRVSMDMITVDVTDIPGAAVGSPVELWGDDIPVDEVAGHSDTIGYELLARMPARVPRLIAT